MDGSELFRARRRSRSGLIVGLFGPSSMLAYGTWCCPVQVDAHGCGVLSGCAARSPVLTRTSVRERIIGCVPDSPRLAMEFAAPHVPGALGVCEWLLRMVQTDTIEPGTIQRANRCSSTSRLTTNEPGFTRCWTISAQQSRAVRAGQRCLVECRKSAGKIRGVPASRSGPLRRLTPRGGPQSEAAGRRQP